MYPNFDLSVDNKAGPNNSDASAEWLLGRSIKLNALGLWSVNRGLIGMLIGMSINDIHRVTLDYISEDP